jgi:DNA-binding protein HU-beta
MTRAELIAAVADRAGLPKADAEGAVHSLLDVVRDALVAGDRVTLPGFGSFDVAERKARSGRNPRTGEAIEIAASRNARFKPSKGLKDTLND